MPTTRGASKQWLSVLMHSVLLSPSQVYAPEYDRPPNDFVRREILTEQHHARGDAHKGDQILVDQDPVGPHTRDPPLPGVKTEGRHRGKEHTVRMHARGDFVCFSAGRMCRL
jgi:hypothetical protein